MKDGVRCNVIVFAWAPDEKEHFLVTSHTIATVSSLLERLRPKARVQLLESSVGLQPSGSCSTAQCGA